MALNRTDLRLVVDNLGPISHASVALKPLTVLIGRNNTGKTYLAQALYAARRAVDASHLSFVAPLSKQEFEAFSEVLERHAYQDPRTKELRKVELPPEVLTKAREWVRQALSDAGSSLDRQLGSSFGVPDVGELRRWDQQESVVVQMHQGSTDNGKGLFGTGGTPGHDPALNSTVTFDRDWDFLARSELIRGSGRDEGESLVRHFSQMLMSAVWQGYIETRRPRWFGPLPSRGTIWSLACMDRCCEVEAGIGARAIWPVEIP